MDNIDNKIEAYCLKCKDKKEMLNGKLLTNKKGGKYLQGTCDCGCKMNKFLSKNDKIDINIPYDK
jgi:hypothetical protein